MNARWQHAVRMALSGVLLWGVSSAFAQENAPAGEEPAAREERVEEIVPEPEVPAAAAPEKVIARGLASWYGGKFHGRRTASGEPFDMHALTAAHRTLPFGTVVRVRSLVNGKTVEVRINDRGPFIGRRVIDLSRGAAKALGLLDSGAGIKSVLLSLPGGNVERADTAQVRSQNALVPQAGLTRGSAAPRCAGPIRRRCLTARRRAAA